MEDEDDPFASHLARMRRIGEREEPYRGGSPYEQATNYYLDHLVDRCADEARRRLPPGHPTSIDLLICMTGMSPRPIVLAYKVLRPKRLVLITSDAAHESVNVVHDHLVMGGSLRGADFSARPCVATDPLEIYRIVREEVDIVTRRNSGSIAAYIDITGGRKVMGASAALAAWQLNLGLSYVDGLYDGDLKQAVPGSDRMLLLDNPTSIFGDQEMQVARQAFASGDFDVAQNRYDDLSARLVQPARPRFMGALSALYRAWSNLDRDALPGAIERVETELALVRRELPHDVEHTVFDQLMHLKDLARGDPRALLLTFSLLDDHYRRLGRHDFAALFSYRTIEQCLSAHFKASYGGFALDNPDWDLLGWDRQLLRESYERMVNLVRGTQGRRSLPSQFGPFAAAVLIAVLGDPLAGPAELDAADALRRLEQLAKARNRSVLAHGEEFIDVDLSSELNQKAHRVLSAYWQVHHAGEELADRLSRLAFLRGDW
ncbi:TIGR02710 family CRISPR-associated CARF protein [Hamadaea sp. NPDC051192]|uniref:TIGR02710 family CRISPR-associated CARF protein n=1 Tax=Hamadaea sp. NPDC051192 TaxID=3154940 RepID=UPI00343F6F3E